jgi:hypothetical protein
VRAQKEKAVHSRAVRQAERFYRCPACGEQVDNDSPEEIRFHHSHVLHPGEVDQRYAVSAAARHHAAQTWIIGPRRACS